MRGIILIHHFYTDFGETKFSMAYKIHALVDIEV